jgi:hypothetical protein
MKKLRQIENTCVPIALRYAAGVEESKVIEKCLSAGMFNCQCLHAAKSLGLKLERVVWKKIKLKQFLKKYPTDLFIMATHNHLFVVDNGRIVDHTWNNAGLSRMVLQAYRVCK